MCGRTDSSDFPTTTSAYNTALSGDEDAFISKLDGGLSNLLASTYLGGNGYDEAYSVSIDTEGNIYVCGGAGADFPTTTGAYDNSQNGEGDAFISMMNSELTNLLASTYLGGSNGDEAYSMSIDSKGNIYVCGVTYSSDFPTTTDAYDTSFNGDEDAFISKLNSGLTNLLASTYLGGSSYLGRFGVDEARSMSIDSKGNIYVCGWTDSSDFPTTTNAYDISLSGGYGDAFMSKFDINGSTTDKKGLIYGFVIDTTEIPIESVKLKLKGKGTKIKKENTTDETGYFEFKDLDADTYKITVKKNDYKTTRQKVMLGNGEEEKITIIMEKKVK